MEETAHTAVLGAGVTGLSAAHSLHRSGQNCTVFESSHQVGGALQTTLRDGFLAEHGPNSLLVRDRRVLALLEEIGIGDGSVDSELQDTLPEAKKRYIVHEGKPCAMPGTPLAMLRSPLFSLRGMLRIAAEPFIPRYGGESEESMAGFVTRRLGAEMLESAAGPFVSGIYAGDPANLSIRHAFPRLWRLENEHRSLVLGALALRKKKRANPHSVPRTRTISFRSGLAALPNALVASLPGHTVRLGCRVDAIRPENNGWILDWTDADGRRQSARYARLVIAVPHHKLADLPLPAEISQELEPVSRIQSPPVTSLVLGFKRDQITHPLDGFGMLIKESEQSPLLGVLFSSSMFEGRAPDGHVTLTCMMGGVKNPHYAQNDDNTVLGELRRLLGVSGDPVFRHRTHWDHAIPQYTLDYQHAADAADSCEFGHPGLYFAGNYRGGVSVTDCILNGLRLGKRLGTKEPGVPA